MGIQERLYAWADHHRGFLFDLVRIYLGLGLFIKGIYFIGNSDHLTNLIAESKNLWFLPAAAAHYIIIAHLVGGLLMAIGFLTRIAALAQIPILVGAVFYVYMPKMMMIEPRQNLEFSALVLFLVVLIAIRGGGPLSLDAKIFPSGESPATT